MKVLITCISLLTASLTYASWDLNDVSYLFPLPKAQEGKSFLLNTKNLFSTAHKDAFKDLVQGYDHLKNPYDTLRVVGMRVDPCFKLKPINENQKCGSQIRLIWQPIINEGTDEVTTHDAAVHTFYELTPSEFSQVMKKLYSLKLQNQKLGISTELKTLNIHPAFLVSARKHSFNNELKTIITTAVNSSKMIRFTFMKRLTQDIWWEFGGEDRQPNGEFLPIQIPRLGNEIKQDFFNNSNPNDVKEMRGTILNNPKDPLDNIQSLFTGWGIHDRPDSLKMVSDALRSLNRIENPRIHNPASMDCVSCHIIEPGMKWLEHKHPKILKKVLHAEGKYVQDFMNKKNLSNSSQFENKVKSLRAFGYFGAEVSINQRTINESAEVTAALNN